MFIYSHKYILIIYFVVFCYKYVLERKKLYNKDIYRIFIVMNFNYLKKKIKY